MFKLQPAKLESTLRILDAFVKILQCKCQFCTIVCVLLLYKFSGQEQNRANWSRVLMHEETYIVYNKLVLLGLFFNHT